MFQFQDIPRTLRIEKVIVIVVGIETTDLVALSLIEAIRTIVKWRNTGLALRSVFGSVPVARTGRYQVPMAMHGTDESGCDEQSNCVKLHVFCC